MENQTSSIESLLEKGRGYIETRVELFKLKALDKSSSVISGFASMIIVVMCCMIFLMLLNIGIAFLLGELLGKVYYGFFLLAAIYGITGLVLYNSRDKILKTPIVNAMVKNILN